ncbi:MULTISPECIES: Stk1 family PASTA domain-containing Ser/Thr kinase [unclassified Lactobacillus]|uniref:Stk1 family PASTA domain-containing Ser/Thr kinase n=1 Tax=unclassified Lactobacillus TaxID=2620435 RepID=UPI0018DB5624|nr:MULTISPECIES: Stk1 family PASTA domain-containing Ser/Thr kinase [unclassified Lactobacillus]MBH9989589.1 Stk1 family PASTA domain-containing Ser/Thr kinase [Lactobacillus sp. M0392]MBI0023292.1 Stk1 family PASTA domain-containing Ser/Thr kinase [Lactobacillus sp. W8171]MBI0044588.1 Stk1 family PASTA domain-containing Ser/Thr kinase [Lactobacillus sp. M0393]
MINKGYLLGDRYRIIDTLGEGGMANVYLAEDIILQRKVAVKILRLDLQKEPQTLARFQREALATSELSHPNIVMVLDVGTDHGLPYMVMEYVDGPDLKEYIRANSPLNLGNIIKIMDQILSAMSLAHKHNVIHRDLKPQNILMDKHGNIKIADFGIAVALNQNSVTQTNSAIGSVHYMSPEQTRGGLVTKQSDIYSLGIILYELITGNVPFNGDSAVSIALKHAQEPIPSIRKQDPNIPQPLENVVLKATAKDPRDRYNSAKEMKDDLDTSLEPGRANEPVFKPTHGNNDDETIILPNFKPNRVVEKTDAENRTQDKTADYHKNRSSFTQALRKYKWWWLFVGFAAILIIGLMFFVLNNNKNSDIRVPDVTNLSEKKARNKLESVGLKVGKIKHRNSDSIDRGKVIETAPVAGSEIKRGRYIDLYISDGAGMVQVPDVTGDEYGIAVQKLEKLGFEVIRENQFSSSVPPDHVISQSVAADVEVKPEQTTITLVISKGKNPRSKHHMIKLPDLKDYSLKQAQEFAHKHGLTLQVSSAYSSKVKKGMIISMSPAAGTQVPRGSTISVNVSEGAKKKRDLTAIKNFTVSYEDNDEDDSDNKRGNHVQIYIADDNHSIDNIYRDLYIKKDMNFSIPFELRDGPGQLKVVRDGQVILNEKVKND